MYIILGVASLGWFSKYLEITVITFVILFIYMLKEKQKVIIPKNKNFYIITCFCIFYAIISTINQNFSSVIGICPILAYYCGLIICNLCNGDENYISKCIIGIAMGFFFHAMLNYTINIGNTNRNTIDFWTRNVASATLQGGLLTMILSMSFYNIFLTKPIWKKVLFIIPIFLSLCYITLIATRTTIIIFIIVNIIEIIIYMILNRKTKKLFKILLIIAIFIIIVAYMYNNGTFRIDKLISETNLGIRLKQNGLEKSDESRIESQMLGVISIINNPFGTKEKIGNLRYAHNMWLDIGKDVGIIPLAFLLAYTINVIISLLKIMTNKNISNNYKILLSSNYIGLLINFLVEPILEGAPLYFIMFVIINAMIDLQVVKIKNNS